jgi:hypothetical protein
MKVRQGFVSNSSSSSFLCGVCGSMEGGIDLTLSEAGMCECVNGHTFCENHLIETEPPKNSDTLETVEQELHSYLKIFSIENPYVRDIKLCLFDIDEFKKNEDVQDTKDKDKDKIIEELLKRAKELIEDTRDYLDEYPYSIPEENCPICQLINIQDKEAVMYLLFQLDISREQLQKEIRNRFDSDWKKFNKFLMETHK